jgi:hypothetical protein
MGVSYCLIIKYQLLLREITPDLLTMNRPANISVIAAITKSRLVIELFPVLGRSTASPFEFTSSLLIRS